MLLFTPIKAQAASLPDALAIGTINITDEISGDEKSGEDKESDKSASREVDGSDDDSISNNAAQDGGSDETSQDEKEDKNAASKSDDTSLQDILGGGSIGSGAIIEATKTEQEYAEAYEKAKNANWGYTNLGIANVDNNLNVRAIAAEDGKLVGKLPKDAACEVLDDDGTWAHIKSGKVEGYVSLEYLLTGIPAKRRAEELATTMARVNTDGLKVRAEANTDSEVITLVANGEELEVAAVEGDWVKVYLDDQEVFVSAEYVEVTSELGTAITMTELFYGQGVSDIRVDVCQYAKEFLGNPYVWGGTSLTKGADCSGYVLSVFKKYGVSLPHSSVAQANCGTTIKVSEAKPGDLIFYGNGKSINHVAICIGNGQVIHASSPKTGIKISNISYRSPIKAVRILYD
ncbi:MAG: SH3 domain-containing protein [Lachnospiraceae bacterium]|nr:SH3 domain-containing protein [Lachnospiraceae bacterium]